MSREEARDFDRIAEQRELEASAQAERKATEQAERYDANHEFKNDDEREDHLDRVWNEPDGDEHEKPVQRFDLHEIPIKVGRVKRKRGK